MVSKIFSHVFSHSRSDNPWGKVHINHEILIHCSECYKGSVRNFLWENRGEPAVHQDEIGGEGVVSENVLLMG